MIKQTKKKDKKIINWSEYNESLKQRGSVEVWIAPDVEKSWYAEPTGKRGAQEKYSDMAIQTMLTIGKVYNQRLRQTEGFVKSLFEKMVVDLEIPDYTTLSRRGETARVKIPLKEKEKVVLIMDSTGLKVYGEGEWKVRKHGYSKRRTWKKLHLGVDKDNEIRVMELTGNDGTDADAGMDMLEKEKVEVESLVADGAYDRRKMYEKCERKEVNKVVIPPQKNAKIWKHGNSKGAPHPRDENLRGIRKSTRKKWKERAGYHVRSLSETAMFRIKTIFSDRLNGRKDETQETEAMIMCTALNTMSKLGMPKYEFNIS